ATTRSTWSSTSTPESCSAGAAEVHAEPEGALAQVEIRPPARIAVGRGNAFVLGGWCYHQAARARGLSVRVGDSVQRVERFGLPRDHVHPLPPSPPPPPATPHPPPV